MRILAFAYACEPGQGSEPGAGWAWARMLARLGETWVITRANNQRAIEAELHRTPERDRLHFVYVDLPPWGRWWKRGQRGVRLYYLLWQARAVRRAGRLDRLVGFDLVWHLTMANAWLGTLASLSGRPFVYGPVGGGTRAPLLLLPVLGPRGIAYEVVRDISRLLGRYVNPVARLAWRRATLILVQNADTRHWLPRRHRSKAEIFPNVVLDGLPPPRVVSRSASQTALFAGRLVPWKGASLAVRTLTHLPGWRLMVIGSGPDEGRLQRLIRRKRLEHKVRLLAPLPREELLRLMRDEATVLLFPSLHDEAGWVVAEAVSSGLPAVCLDVGGPPSLGARAVAASTPSVTASALAAATVEASSAPPNPPPDFNLSSRTEMLRALLVSRGLLPPRSGGIRDDAGTSAARIEARREMYRRE